MEKNSCKPLMEEPQQEQEDDEFEEFHEDFRCCVCMKLLYKPIVLVCGHVSCIWCVFKALNFWHESCCSVCQHPYNHFPGICQLLHFLLIKLYPVSCKGRERQVGEEETKMGHFLPQFDSYLHGPHPINGIDILGAALHSPSHQQEGHCSREGKSSSYINSSQMTVECGNDICKSATTSNSSEAATNATTEECSLYENQPKYKAQNKISIDDLSCAACKRMLFRLIVLNCGHVFCESCISVPKDGNFKCPVCQSLHPHGQPRSGKPEVHVNVGCNFCGMCPIIGERYKCKDCVEKIGFDLREACYHNPVKIPGRFNQQHKAEHKFEIVQPLNIGDLLFRNNAELSDNDGSDATENRDAISGAPISSGDAPQDPEDNSTVLEDASSAYIFSVDVSVDPRDDSDDPSSEPT